MRAPRSVLSAGIMLISLAVASPAAALVAPESRAQDTAWASTAALPSGALATYPDRTRVDPYIGGFAAWGLADEAGRSRDRAALERAWAHLSWHADSQDERGYVTDYAVAADGSLASTGDMDSTDSYAALFALAAEAAYRSTRALDGASAARGRLTALAPGLDGALRAVESTVASDGLTWAKPTWRVAYLMDQAEVYAGMTSAGRLFAALGDSRRAKRARSVADGVRRGVAGLWNPARGSYDWARHEDGSTTAADLEILYPDALEQVWAVAFGLVPTKRAAPLLARIDALHPELADPQALMTTRWGTDRVGYWPMAAAAWLQVGDDAAADRLLTSIDTAAADAGRPWPFTSGNAGQVLVVSGLLRDGSSLP